MTSPRTVLHTIETSGIGGAETVLMQVASQVDPSRFRSIAAIPSRGALRDALEACGVATHVIESHRWWDLKLPRGLAQLCRREHVDLVHSHLPDHNFSSCLAATLVRRPVIATYHGQLDFWRARSWRGGLKLAIVRRTAAANVGVCDAVRSTLLDWRFPESRVRRIYNGVDVVAAGQAGRADLRRHFGWPDDTPLVGTVANLRQTKGYEYFVRAARLVVDSDPRVRFVAAGDLDAVVAPPIQALVKELGLEGKVEFLGFRADVQRVIHDMDVFVMASTSEGFPLVLLEAMAARRPVVVTRCGGPEEILKDAVNGMLVPTRDAPALARGVLSILQDPALGATLGAAAEADAAAFSIERMVHQYQNLYDHVLAA